ncbi:MAG: alpha/beta fold hydrolase [Labilithrix sp.]|nr:alpha/beta fold hydrolase [Labilithrix sp.]MCW5811274.1 alpha/beta fold hydrolase [Labilithrix sp.]
MNPPATHGYLDGPRPVFASYHAPRGIVRDIRWILCAPHGWEGIQSYETVKLLADELAASGFHAVRVHYDGTGESFGTDEDPDRVAAWTESIRRAVAALGAGPVGLVGLRIGATLAGAVAATHALEALVLWEPCVSGAHYTREMEILASASPRAVKDGQAAQALGIEAGGYLLTPETVASLNAIDLMKTAFAGAPKVLVLGRDDRPPLFAKKLADRLEGAAFAQVPGYKELMTYPEKAKPGVAMVERIRDWALGVSSTGDYGGLTLAAEATWNETRRRPIRFGPESRLLGVLTEPALPATKTKRPVLLLTGGVVPRTSVNRMYVVLATRLAEMGHRVLRMDVSGICESPPAPGAAPNDPHAASLLDDARAAVSLLLEDGGGEIAMLGLCSGAYASFQTALADERVRSITLLNPEVFHLADGSPKFSQTEQSHAASHYKKSLLSPAAWKKLLTGKANVGYIAGFALAKAKTTIETARERIEARVKKTPQGLAGDLHRLLARGVAVAIVMAENDSGYDALMAQLSADLERLKSEGLRFKLTPGPDHTFNDFSTRLPLVEWLVEVLAS